MLFVKKCINSTKISKICYFIIIFVEILAINLITDYAI